MLARLFTISSTKHDSFVKRLFGAISANLPLHLHFRNCLLFKRISPVAILSAVGVPVLNGVLPSTDPCAWLRYIWPTSNTEIQAVQKFVITKLRELHEVKCKEVAIDAVKDLKDTSDIRIRGVKRSLDDDLKFVRDGDNILNKRRKITDRLQNSFEGFEEKVHNI